MSLSLSFFGRVQRLLVLTVVQMTQKLLNYQAPSQVAREPTSAFAKVPFQRENQICFATCTTGSVSPK